MTKTRAQIHEEARSLIASGADARAWRTFGEQLLQFQFEHNPHLARLCLARGLSRETLSLDSAPAIPTDVFKMVTCFSGDTSEITRTFHTSGTTQALRGAHHFSDVETYRLGALTFGATALLDVPRVVWALNPSEQAAPDSSLTFMIAAFGAERSLPGSRNFFEGTHEHGRLLVEALRDAQESRPVLLMATSFALVHLLDACAERGILRMPLPTRSVVMQTGGFKGRSREVSAPLLRAQVAALFSVPETSVVSEYGMTELSSQFYERTAVEANWPHGTFSMPPWARVTAVDRTTLMPLTEGEIGIARITDLLNIDSACLVLTQDLVRCHGDRFELFGRASDAEARGCSIAIDDILGGARGR